MRRAVVVVFLFLIAPLAGRAQSGPNPSGHWVGTLHTVSDPLPVEVDIARSSTGQLSGT
jgi:hypothetical protein